MWWLRVGSAVLLTAWVGADALYRAAPTLTAEAAGYARAAQALSDAVPDDEGVEVWTDVQHCMRFYMTRPMRERAKRVTTSEEAADFMMPRPVERWLVVDLRVLRHRSKANEYLAFLDALDRDERCEGVLDNPLNAVTRLNTLTFQELRQVNGEPGSALSRRVRRMAIYRLPADWAPRSPTRSPSGLRPPKGFGPQAGRGSHRLTVGLARRARRQRRG